MKRLTLSEAGTAFDKKTVIKKRLAGSGKAALLDNDLEESVRGFYQVIENTGTKASKEFKSLRAACSHQRIDRPSTAEAIRKFGISMSF
jgi:hypothetical protein